MAAYLTFAEAERLARSRRATKCPLGCGRNLSARIPVTSTSATSREVVLGAQLRVDCKGCGYGEIYWPLYDPDAVDILDADYDVKP